MKWLLLLPILLLLATQIQSAPSRSPKLAELYHDAAARIIGAAVVDRAAWERLAYLCDHFPKRISGSEELEGAIRWATEQMKKDGLENVRAEPVMVPKWVRGRESVELLEPSRQSLVMLGLGMSVGTPSEGITGEVVVVSSFDELTALGETVKGKIVLYNVPFTNYGQTVVYRAQGASRASKQGAVGMLLRSVGPPGLRTPHTGVMYYDEGVTKIPAAAVTLEDAEMMARMQRRGERIRVRLKMEAKQHADVPSANVVGELRGREKPEEIVVLGGHLDCWDVAQGAMDDGGGCIATWEAVRLLKELNLRPRRTLRVVLFTNEENGTRGGNAYRDTHRAELKNHVVAIESDSGVTRPLGFGLTLNPKGLAEARQIGSLLDGIGAGSVTEGGGGVDIGPMGAEGVPLMSLRVDESRYWDLHHTPADTVDKIDPTELSRCVAALAVMIYGIAEMPQRLGGS